MKSSSKKYVSSDCSGTATGGAVTVGVPNATGTNGVVIASVDGDKNDGLTGYFELSWERKERVYIL